MTKKFSPYSMDPLYEPVAALRLALAGASQP